MMKQGKCCICGKTYDYYGNNPRPVKKNGRCCDECNKKYVIPWRLYEYYYYKEQGLEYTY